MMYAGSRIGSRRQLDLGLGWRAQKAAVTSARVRRARVALLFGVMFMWNCVVIARLGSLQISETWKETALRQHVQEMQLSAERGVITDRNGQLLAVSVPASSLYVRPKQVTDAARVVKEVSRRLRLRPADVEAALKKNSPFVWLRRQVPRSVAEQVLALDLPGVGAALESRRVYPFNEAASALIGKVGVDGNGLSGIEALYEKSLHAEQVRAQLFRDAFGKVIEVNDADAERLDIPKGEPVRLTIDASLQMIMDEELLAGKQATNAKSAFAVMIDAATGEVLAMSQAPSHNFNNPSMGGKDDFKNLLVESVFEPGSILKPLVAAAAIDEGVIRESDVLNCEHGRYKVGRHTIKDVHRYNDLTLQQVVIRSSNIGMTKVGMKLGAVKLYQSLRRFGFGENTALGLAGESAGILRPVSRWALVDVATHSFGQGVAVTPLQMVRAMAAIANGGRLPALRVVADERGFESRQVVSERAAAQVREMLFGVVEDKHGTGKLAAVKGVRIGGKTGTAQKARPGGRGYMPGAYMASFVGFADASSLGIQQDLVLMVVVDEARASSIYGGTLAAPIFRRIMQRSIHTLATRRTLHGERDELPRDGVPSLAPVNFRS